jgi:hypothetical protein
VRQDFDKVATGFNHFLVYFTARAYWPGYEPAAALREYCRLFYGPAETEMLTFFTFCDANWKVMDEDKAKADEALASFDKAKAKTDAESVFGKRLALIDDFLKGLRMKSQQLGQKRGPVPTVRLVGDAKDVVIDGKLDDEYWQNCPVAATGKFRELQTGRTPTFGTSFKAGWQGNNLSLPSAATNDAAKSSTSPPRVRTIRPVWHGDAIEIELATETHSYYQIAISPNGHVVDLDRGAPRSQWFTWDCQGRRSPRTSPTITGPSRSASPSPPMKTIRCIRSSAATPRRACPGTSTSAASASAKTARSSAPSRPPARKASTSR